MNIMVLLNATSVEADPEMVGEFITSRDITILSSMVNAGAIVEIDKEKMPFMNDHDYTLEEVEIAAANLTVSIWARIFLSKKSNLYTALVLDEGSMFAPFKPFSPAYEHYKKALLVYNYD